MISVCLLSTDAELALQFQKAFACTRELSLQHQLQNGVSLLALLIQHVPDILVVDMTLSEIDMLDIIEMLAKIPMRKPPLIFALCGMITPAIQNALQSKVTYCFTKPLDYADSARQIAQIAQSADPVTPSRKLNLALLDRAVSEHLFRLSVSPHLQGYHYLREAIKLVASVRTPAKISVMKQLYPAVSALCRTRNTPCATP